MRGLRLSAGPAHPPAPSAGSPHPCRQTSGRWPAGCRPALKVVERSLLTATISSPLSPSFVPTTTTQLLPCCGSRRWPSSGPPLLPSGTYHGDDLAPSFSQADWIASSTSATVRSPLEPLDLLLWASIARHRALPPSRRPNPGPISSPVRSTSRCARSSSGRLNARLCP